MKWRRVQQVQHARPSSKHGPVPLLYKPRTRLVVLRAVREADGVPVPVPVEVREPRAVLAEPHPWRPPPPQRRVDEAEVETLVVSPAAQLLAAAALERPRGERRNEVVSNASLHRR